MARIVDLADSVSCRTHHVEAHHLYVLTSEHRRLVLDRLRLCSHLGQLTAEQRVLLDEVLAETVAIP
jgi:hypothetical protein